MSAQGDGVLVAIGAASAFAAGLLAVTAHADCTTAGYELAVARREAVILRQTADAAERRVAELSTMQAATARAAAMKLTRLRYPKTWNVVSAATLRACADAPAAPAPTRTEVVR
jgi:hypothetical protein